MNTQTQAVATFVGMIFLGCICMRVMDAVDRPPPPRPVSQSWLSESEKSQQRFAIKQRWKQYYEIKYPDWSPWLRNHTAEVDALAEIRQKGLE